MTRTLEAVLVTLGDPGQLTGGQLLTLLLADAVPPPHPPLTVGPLPEAPFPLGLFDAPDVVHAVQRREPDVVVVDSIVTWTMAFARVRQPMLGMLHQPPGGIDSGPLRTALQARLDRLAYRKLRRLL